MATESNEVVQQQAFEKTKEYWKEFPEAPFSDSFKWIDKNGFDHISIARGWTFPALMTSIERATTAILEAGGKSLYATPPAAATANPPPAEPTRQPIDDGGNELPDVKTARAGRLSVEMKDGKYFYKVMDAVFMPGEKSTKYGINVWPEVLKAAKLDVSNPAVMPEISGWRVDYICNEKGYPGKVTRLLPSAAPY